MGLPRTAYDSTAPSLPRGPWRQVGTVSGWTGIAPHVAWYDRKKSVDGAHTEPCTESLPSQLCGLVSSSLRIFSA